jgi:hypothetical protein
MTESLCKLIIMNAETQFRQAIHHKTFQKYKRQQKLLL